MLVGKPGGINRCHLDISEFQPGCFISSAPVVVVLGRPKPVPWWVVGMLDCRVAALIVGGVAFVGRACFLGAGKQPWLRGWR